MGHHQAWLNHADCNLIFLPFVPAKAGTQARQVQAYSV